MKRFSDLFLASLALLLLGVPILFLIWQVRRKLVARSLPLPLDSINNLRSFVGIDNLVDFIITCLEHPAAANETFLVSDGGDLSTPDLIRRMARAMSRPARLLPVPVWALKAGASLLGKGDEVQRLCGNLQVDISKARSLLGWVPPVSVEEGLRRAVGWAPQLRDALTRGLGSGEW